MGLGEGGGGWGTSGDSRPSLFQSIGNWFSNLFGGKKSTATGHTLKATVIDIALIPEGVEVALTWEEVMAAV